MEPGDFVRKRTVHFVCRLGLFVGGPVDQRSGQYDPVKIIGTIFQQHLDQDRRPGTKADNIRKSCVTAIY
jgi:hypothetical protein